MGNVRLEQFGGIIEETVKRVKINHSMDEDDLGQELSMKIFEILPKLEETDPEWLETTVRRVIWNKIKDIQRYYGVRPDTSIFAGTSWIDELEGTVEHGAAIFLNKIQTPEMRVQYSHLVRGIKNWANQTFKQDWEKRFISEIVDPSDDTLSKYEALMVDNPRCSGFAWELPVTLGRALGLSPKQSTRIIEMLRRYLSSVGYATA